MGNYLANSSNIFVFPTTKREQVSRSSRLLTEKNIVDIINKLVDVESFVITRGYVYGSDSSIDFNIYGYYFNVSNFDDVVDAVTNGESISQSSSIWANIIINKIGDYDELYGTDENGEYGGVIFTFNGPMNGGLYQGYPRYLTWFDVPAASVYWYGWYKNDAGHWQHDELYCSCEVYNTYIQQAEYVAGYVVYYAFA